MGIMDMVMQQLGGGGISQISQMLGADEGTTGKGIAAALPLLLSSLSHNASTPEGAANLQNAVTQDHAGGGILDDVMGFLGRGGSGDGAGILSHVFGGQQDEAANTVSQQSGLTPGASGQLLQTLAPLVMGALGRTQQQEGLDAGGLSSVLGQQAQSGSSSGLMGMISGLLGSGKGGGLMDEVSTLAGNFLGKQ